MGPVPDEPAIGTGPKVWLRSFSRALPVGRPAVGSPAAATLPKHMTHGVPISGGAASFFPRPRSTACAAQSAPRHDAARSAPQGNERMCGNRHAPQQKGPAAVRRAGPGTARNRGSLRSNRAKLRASSPCRIDRRAHLRNEEGQIVIPREKHFRAAPLAPKQPAGTDHAATCRLRHGRPPCRPLR